jgi:hypothetical protein
MFEDRGVKTSTRVEVAPPGVSNFTVLNVVPMQQFAIRYVDGDGRVRNTTIVQVGDQFYEPKNAEAWTGTLGTVNDWLRKILVARVLAGAGQVPKTDAVDVVGAPA